MLSFSVTIFYSLSVTLLTNIFVFVYFLMQVAMTNVLLWIFTWTPYAVITMIGCFGNSMLVTPMASMVPAVLGLMPFLSTHPRFSVRIHVLIIKERVLTGFELFEVNLPLHRRMGKINPLPKVSQFFLNIS